MKRFIVARVGIVVLLAMMCTGCGSSGGSYGKSDSPETSAPPAAGSADQASKSTRTKSDTLNVNPQNTTNPVYNTKTQAKGEPSGKFSVQVGAYRVADSAERIASLARERFGKNVYTIPDKTTDLYKVLVGDFTVKDDARKFRDEMVQKYPSDYKDAWVSEIPPQ